MTAMTPGTRTTLDAFNAADRDAAIALLRPCLDIDRWCAELAEARPYGSVAELLAWAEAAASPFTRDEVEVCGCVHAKQLSPLHLARLQAHEFLK